MSVTTTTQSSPFANAIVYDSDVDGTVENNVRGGATTVYIIELDNTANAGTVAYLKLYNSVAATVGTDAPTMVLAAAASGTAKWNNLAGYAFATGLSFACVTDGGGTAGTTSPVSNATCRILCT